MMIATQLAQNIRGIFFGGNWTVSNLKDVLSDLHWEQACKKDPNSNSIIALVYHISYFVTAATNVLEGRPINASDKFSFDHPSISSQEEWNEFLDKIYQDAENLATLVESLTDKKVWEVFEEEKYGNYFQNIVGIIEHAHYHLGQIVILKKQL